MHSRDLDGHCPCHACNENQVDAYLLFLWKHRSFQTPKLLLSVWSICVSSSLSGIKYKFVNLQSRRVIREKLIDDKHQWDSLWCISLAKGTNSSNILIPGEWVQGHGSLSCCLWSSLFSTCFPSLQKDFLKLKRKSWLLSEMQIGWDRVSNTLYPLKLQQLMLASQSNYMSTSKSRSTFFTGNIVYPHDRYYWPRTIT